MTNSFISFDFETANKFRGSPCEIGLVRFVDGKQDAILQSLIKPPPGHDHFDKFNTQLHGIDAHAVKDAPEFIEFLPEILDFSSGLPFVAHNAQFDSGVIRDTLDVYGENWPELQYFCTLVLSRRLLKLDNYRLPTVASALEVELGTHHRALDDAIACGHVASKLVEVKKASGLPALARKVQVQPGRITSNSWTGCKREGFEEYKFKNTNTRTINQVNTPTSKKIKKDKNIAEWVTTIIVSGALANTPEIGDVLGVLALVSGTVLILTGAFSYKKIFRKKL